MLSPAEALYGFAGWLTTQDEPITMCAKNDAAIVAEKVGEFCRTNKLEEPREDWHKELVHPS